MRLEVCVILLRIHLSMASTNCHTPSSSHSTAGDCRPLSYLYSACGGAEWTSCQHWFGAHDDLCNRTQPWYGVVCRDDSETNDTSVTSLLLSENNLVKTLPTEVGLLTHLRGSLDLSQNLLESQIPSQVGLLTHLTRDFDLSSNKFSKQIPSQIGCLTGLARLDLSYNSFTGAVPNQVAELCAKLNSQISGSCSLGTPTQAPTTFTQLPTVTRNPTYPIPSTVAPPESNNSVLVAALVGIGLIVAGGITLCILRAIRRAQPTLSLRVDHDGYFPFKDAADGRDGLSLRKDYGKGSDYLNEAELNSHEGSDRNSEILPGSFGLDLKAYLIQLEDLNLEQKPFAKGGCGQVVTKKIILCSLIN